MSGDFTRRSYAAFGGLGPGSRIAGYLIEEQIGAGGMAVVFRARDEVLGRVAAVKVIAPQVTGDEEFRSRFLRESRSAAAVDSPHIVPVYGAGEDSGLLYIATRFVAGGDLAGLVRRSGGRLDAWRAAALVEQVASALDAAHATGLVHRDVKLANILVDDVPGLAEHAYLADFGLSKGMASVGPTPSGQFLGTPDYSAPEQVRGGRVDGRADQYALGCVAFELLTGAPPFRRPDAMATLLAHLQDPVPPVTRQRPDLPAAVDAVMARALAKRPGERYDGCGEFAAALREGLAAAGPVAAGPVDPPGSRRLAQRPPAADMAAADGEPAQHADTVAAHAIVGLTAGGVTTDGVAVDEGAVGGSSAGRGDAGRRSRWSRARAAWAAGAAVVLAAGAVTAVALLNAPSPGPASNRLSSGPTGSSGPAHLAASAASPSQAAGNGITARVLQNDVDLFSPGAVADDGTHLWVVNQNDYGGAWPSSQDSVTELNTANGAVVRVLRGGSYGFVGPDAIAADGTHVWVANYAYNESGDHDSVTELNASDGSVVRVLKGSKYGIGGPAAIAVSDGHVWIANVNVKDGGSGLPGSVTELNASDGSVVRVLKNGKYGFVAPDDIAVAGSHIWVEDSGTGAVTELNASDGSVARVVKGARYGVAPDGFSPVALTVVGSHVWVANSTTDHGDWVTELSASDGSLVRVLKGARYGFSRPYDIAVSGGHVWVANGNGDSVTEVNAANGTVAGVLKSGSYDFAGPDAIAVDGNHVWVTNATGDSVTELTTG